MVGSDVPLFLIGGAVLGTDHGQEVYPLPDIKPAIWCVVAIPDVGVSTPQAFRDWDLHWADKGLNVEDGLTAEGLNSRMKMLSTVYASVFAGGFREVRMEQALPVSSLVERTWPDRMSPRLSAPGSVAGSWNDFEQVVFPQHPSLAEIKRVLAADGTPEAACTCLAVGIWLSSLRVVSSPRRCRCGPGTVAGGGCREPFDAHFAASRILAADASDLGVLTACLCERETRGRLSKAASQRPGNSLSWAIV